MTKLYVGTTPIEKVYAGTNVVWSKADFEIEQYKDKRGVVAAGFDAWCISWSYNFDPFTCEEAGNLFSVRIEQYPYGTSGWTPWMKFNELAFSTNQCWLYKADDRLVYCDISTNSLVTGYGGRWQVRLTENGKTTIKEVVKTDIRTTGPDAPSEWFETQCV